MKKISVLMAAFMAVCMSALADDGIKVNPLTIAQGETADLEIMFECAEEKYVGYQFDVTAEGLGFNIDIDNEEGYEGGECIGKEPYHLSGGAYDRHLSFRLHLDEECHH